MTDLHIPDTVPARPGAAGASANDLRGRHQSATLNMATGQVVVESKGVVKADVATAGTGTPVFTRVQSRSGMIDDATLDTIVSGPSIPGDGVRLRDALAAGFVSRDAAGNYVAGAAAEKSLADPKGDDDEKTDKDKGDTGDGEALDAEAEKSVDSLIESTSPDEQLAAIAQVAETGSVSEALIAQVAESQGVTVEAVGEQVGSVLASFEKQARASIEAASGVPSETVVQYLRENKLTELKAAEFEHATKRSTAGYTALAKSYVLDMDVHSPDAILGATFPDGQSAHRDGRGNIIITASDGIEYPWKTAVRAGMLSIS